MRKISTAFLWVFVIAFAVMLGGCGGSDASPSDGNTSDGNTSHVEKVTYKGLQFYYDNLPPSSYKLDQLTDGEFAALSEAQRLSVADKLLTSLFFGYPLETFREKINQDDFMSALRTQLDTKSIDVGALEAYLLDDKVFKQYQSQWYEPQAITILTRFYAMEKLDQYFLHNWIAYILTQTIMFSPAYELTSTHTPNIASVYNRLVTMLSTQAGMRYMTYVHMSSEDNWRRFRSPEDNGREMLEIYLLDTNDSHVPLAGKALQNWKLNTDSDTLEVGLNRNTKPLDLFGTTVYNGDDFYRELVKSDAFTHGVTRRLVDFFFPQKSLTQRESITDTIVSSKPETWQDILLQILFSEEYLLHNARPKSAEETFFALAKKIQYRHKRTAFAHFKDRLTDMHQASMKYKLGKLERVPLDSLSFAHYHQFIRSEVLLRVSKPEAIDDYDSWNRLGWDLSFIAENKMALDSSDDPGSLATFVDYLFQSLIARSATAAEQKLFRDHMIEKRDGKELFRNEFNIFITYKNKSASKQAKERTERRKHIAIIVMDYLSRLDALYAQHEEK
jgi:hypothetical protein